ncbi:Fur-regulated basic protein FbpA [Oceanobacillus indicireducens]|uniref:Uncharacterized protein n=1 Tax=Oceanobacillus indicireducens TaxID=1004261 RepID=A0A917Y679_9BACI|nr:Fur-regulated basic protein FbpA [Oceanobacillus indicireducens]GGN66446.1 hypothetical protein GCM10007971_36460 [Oceanobacillus indicireducens]
MQTLDKNNLINRLPKMGIYHTSDGRNIEDVSLYTLMWTYISVKCDAARAYGEETQ